MLTNPEILDALAAGHFAGLVGEVESETLECKGQPYILDTDARKLELAKDVSALANARGGLILLGFETVKDAAHGSDVVDRLSPFPQSLIDPDQYLKVLQAWSWPPLDNVEVKVFPSPTDRTACVAAIIVSQASDESRPHLIVKNLIDTNRRADLLVGYCERKQAHVAHYDVSRLHSLLRDGRHFDTEIRAGFQALQATMEQLALTPPAIAVTPEDLELRTSTALRAAGRLETPALVLSATPSRALNLRPLFEARDTATVQLLENPPSIRSGGFNLRADRNSRIVEGRLRRALFEGYELLEFHRDGVAIYVAPGDGDRLCWGQAQLQTDAYVINQMALVEMTYLFCALVEDLYRDQLRPGEQYQLEMRVLRLNKGDRAFYLLPGPLSLFPRGEVFQAREGSTVCRVQVHSGEVSAARAAVMLLSELYAWIGYEEDKIPYTAVVDGVRVVDPNEILEAGRRRAV